MSSNQHLEIVPSNVTSDGKLSFYNGQPVVQFIIGEQDRYLLGQSLKINGNFSALFSAGNISLNASTLDMDGRTSLYSTIDQLVIKSQATNQTIEHIRNYNRFMASYLSTTNDLGDGLSHMNETGLQVLNSTAMKKAIVDNGTNLSTTGASTFSLALPCGLLNGTGPIPLAKNWGVGGLIIEIHLAADSNVLYANDGVGSVVANSFYQYQNMTLSCEVQRPAPQDLQALEKSGSKGSTFEYNSISSYYTTINSANAIINFSLGLSRVLSVFCNFIQSNHINNRDFNGMTTWYPRNSDATVATIKQLIFTRGGERLPLEYNIDTIQSRSTDSNNKYPDAQILRNYVNAIQSFPKNNRNTMNPENMRMVNGDPEDTYNNFIDGGAAFGVGVAFDTISNQGVSFQSTPFGINMDLDLITDNPNSVYMFVHHKNTLVFNPTGIQVIN